MTWLLLREGPGEPAWNMALDEALLGAAETDGLCTLRLYSWGPPALSFGRNEPALRRYDPQAIRARGLATVRRPTGGRAVWHDREVTYSVSAPTAAFGSLRDSYLAIHDLLAAALRSLGAPVTLAADRPATGVGAGACFASAAGGEVMTAAGGKVVGSAQVRTGSAFLQHGSILLTAQQDVVASLTRGSAERPHATGLDELLPAEQASADAVSDAIAREAARRWAVQDLGGAPAGARRRAESRLAHYRDDAWTWRR